MSKTIKTLAGAVAALLIVLLGSLVTVESVIATDQVQRSGDIATPKR
jgi:hypothetical protein